MPRARVFSGTVSTPAKSPVKIPLNDDRQEKANRLHSRQAQHEIHMNQIKAAATPMRKRHSLLGRSPRTPGDDDHDLPSIGGTAVTPMKRVPILANFEEWMKMATDNKINATNSWNFALIDYFHDMSLLKEGDGVNFQRASCTLDGCVKIYTNRVDSVATETNRLLTGLADSKSNDEDGGEAGSDHEDGDEDEEGSSKKKTKKRAQRSAESTLATSFSQLQVKKMELEFAIDPLFKKASADFDEGGAKGLLLNHLSIDSAGRIVFDSSDDVQESTEQPTENDDAPAEDESTVQEKPPAVEVDLGSLATKFFPDLSVIEHQDICPSLKTFELGSGETALDLPFLKAPEEWKQQSQSEEQNANALNMAADDDDDDLLGGLDLADEVAFGEGGEAWAREVALEPQMRLYNASQDDNGGYDSDAGDNEQADNNGNARYAISMRQGAGDEQQNILDYFDKALKSNWAGPEHWKIRKVKDTAAAAANPAPTKRKEREPFEIDFLGPMSQQLSDALYTSATSSAAISLPKTQWRSKTRNLLPDDKHFNSRQLLRLFLKPHASLAPKAGKTQGAAAAAPSNPVDVDEQYWAQQQGAAPAEADETVQGNYDANFFQDDGFNAPGAGDDDDGDDDEFADAREHFSPEAEGGIAAMPENGERPGSQDGGYGAQLVTQSRRLRPEYVNYARVAKKVDVRRLKEEIWKGLAFEQPIHDPSSMEMDIDVDTVPDKTLQFTEVVNSLKSVYPKQAMADISTSYCFICVLHLANEKGLVIENSQDFQNLSIRKDHTAEIVGLA